MHKATPKLPNRRVYYEAIDLTVLSLIRKASAPMPTWIPSWLKLVIYGDHYEAEFKFLEASYREDVDTGALPGHATEYFGSYVIGEDGCQCVLMKSCWQCQSFQNQKRS